MALSRFSGLPGESKIQLTVSAELPATASLPMLRRFLLLFLLAGTPACAAEPFATQVKPLIEEHCIACHGPDVQKANLRLDNLAPDLANERTAAVWANIHDKLKDGSMPPKKRERPAEGELKAALGFLNKGLHAASLERQQTKGRVVVRRLNGTEYENTIRDLLGTNVKLKEMLPEDNSVAGFDNIAAALDVSATHQLLYQEAAEKAVLSTVPPHPFMPAEASSAPTNKNRRVFFIHMLLALGTYVNVSGRSVNAIDVDIKVHP